MRGDLSEMSAADVCRELAASDADGILEIEGPDGRGALVWRAGQVIAASSPTPRARLGDRLIGAGLLSEEALEEVLHRQARDQDRRRLGAILVDEGLVSRDAVRLVAQEQVLDAVFDVLRWRYGAYRLDPLDEDATPEIPLRLPVPHLLAEVARRQREWAELERVIPDLAAVPSFRDQVTADAALEPDEFAVLASVDGTRSVRELADDLGYGEFEAARIVFGLWLLGIVEVAPPEDEVGRALEDALRDVERATPGIAAPPTARTHLAPPHGAVQDDAPAADARLDPPPPPPPADTRAVGAAAAGTDDEVATGARTDVEEAAAEHPVAEDATAAEDHRGTPTDAPSSGSGATGEADDADDADPWAALESWAGPEVDAPADDTAAADTAAADDTAAIDDREALDEAATTDEREDGPAPVAGTGDRLPPPPPRPSSHQSPDEVDLDALIERLDAERPDPITPSSGGWVDPPATPVWDAAGTSDDRASGATDADAATGADGGVRAPDASDPADHAPEPSTPRRDADDVAELLRELSRLALDDDAPSDEPPAGPSAPAPPRPSAPPSRPAERDDGKRKRRGLFGR